MHIVIQTTIKKIVRIDLIFNSSRTDHCICNNNHIVMKSYISNKCCSFDFLFQKIFIEGYTRKKKKPL